MGLFTNSTMEQAIDKATDGNTKTAENWGEILEIVDMIEVRPDGAKEALRCLMKRVKDRNPHTALLALTLLDACVANAKRKFHVEIASRFFDDEVKEMLQNSQKYPRPVMEKLCMMIKKWSENEFKSDSSLNLIPSLYSYLRNSNSSFLIEAPGKTSTQSSSVKSTTDSAALAKQREEEEIHKAIQLSLEEEKKKQRSSSSSAIYSSQSASLYPSMNDNLSASSSAISNNSVYSTVNKSKEPRKVRAMYDFEAVEDNELTFKAGEIINVLDDSDKHWWKGSNHRGEGLFPVNFVTSDLNWEPEQELLASGKNHAKDDAISLASLSLEQKPVKIDEELIDKTLNMIHDADPTGERPDPADLISLEDQCSRMWPLIDEELQKTDRLQFSLDELSAQITDALATYDRVMKEQATEMSAAAGEHSIPPGYYPHPSQMHSGQYPQPGMMSAQGPTYADQVPSHAGYQQPPYQMSPAGVYQQNAYSPNKLAAAAGMTMPPPTGQPYNPQVQNPVNYGVPPQNYSGYYPQPQ